jgi:hypothetical protein
MVGEMLLSSREKELQVRRRDWSRTSDFQLRQSVNGGCSKSSKWFAPIVSAHAQTQDWSFE